MRTTPPPLRVAILGCGKVTETLHLPSAAAVEGVELIALADAHQPRARELADAWGVPHAVSDWRDAVASADAAIVALPNHLHAPVTIELLQRGLHVLVEKPMALESSECDAMIAAAESAGRAMAVGLVRRHYASSQWIRSLIQEGALGRVVRVDADEGGVFGWKVKSDFMFRREAGGGVLADLGVHALDLLLWWLGDADVVSYRDDAYGGVEADCRIELAFEGGAVGTVALSRLRKMRNTIRIEGERGTVELGNGADPDIRMRFGPEPFALVGRAEGSAREDGSLRGAFERQLADFVRAARSGVAPAVPGSEGARAVRLIEACRAAREPLEHRWDAAVPGAGAAG